MAFRNSKMPQYNFAKADTKKVLFLQLEGIHELPQASACGDKE